MDRKRQKGRTPPPRQVATEQQSADADRDVAEIFGGVGTELLTDALVAELVGRGWEESRLREAQQLGGRYNRRRDSLFLDDPEHSGSFGFD